MDPIYMNITVKKKLYFWPFFFYLKFMVYRGKVSIEDSVEFLATRCCTIKENKRMLRPIPRPKKRPQ
jgi:hypothetical protein